MSIGVPPLNSAFAVKDNLAIWSAPWGNWMSALFSCIFGWRKSYTGTLAKTWGAISGAAEASATTSITGVRTGDAVIVQPSAKTTGIIDNIGVVTADDIVTIFAQNTTAAGITPGVKTYRILVFQQ